MIATILFSGKKMSSEKIFFQVIDMGKFIIVIFEHIQNFM
jgi:hypothetical protein